MSNECLNWVKSLDPKFIKASPRQILKELADYADENNSCYPGTELLHEVTSQSVRTVQANLRILESMGLITTIPRPNNSSRYILNRHKPFPMRKLRKRGAKSAPLALPAEMVSEVCSPEQASFNDDGAISARGAKSAPQGDIQPPPARGADSVALGVQNLSSRGAKSAPKPSGNHHRTIRGRGACARPTPLPEAWQPSEGDLDYARRLGLDVAALTVRFRKQFLASGREFLNWSKRWELWCDEDAAKVGAQPAPSAAGGAVGAPVGSSDARVRAFVGTWLAKRDAGENTAYSEQLMAERCPEALAEVRRIQAETSQSPGNRPEIFRSHQPQGENFFTQP